MTHDRRNAVALDIAARFSVGEVHIMSNIDPWCNKMHKKIDTMAHEHPFGTEELDALRKEIDSLRQMIRRIFADIRCGRH